MRIRPWAGGIAAGLLMLAGAGCDDLAQSPASLIDEPRILAVQAEPPVVSLDGAAALTALVVDATGAQRDDALMTWRVCSPWAFVIDPARDCGPAVSLPLADAVLRPADVLERFPPPFELPAGGAPGTDGACPPTIEVPVLLEARLDGRALVAIRRVPIVVQAGARTNPTLGAVALDQVPEPVTYQPGQAHVLEVLPVLDTLDPSCADAAQPESVRINIYVSAGEIDVGTLAVSVDATGSVSAEQATWLAPDDGPVALWFVLRDDDGGVAWRSLHVTP